MKHKKGKVGKGDVAIPMREVMGGVASQGHKEIDALTDALLRFGTVVTHTQHVVEAELAISRSRINLMRQVSNLLAQPAHLRKAMDATLIISDVQGHVDPIGSLESLFHVLFKSGNAQAFGTRGVVSHEGAGIDPATIRQVMVIIEEDCRLRDIEERLSKLDHDLSQKALSEGAKRLIAEIAAFRRAVPDPELERIDVLCFGGDGDIAVRAIDVILKISHELEDGLRRLVCKSSGSSIT